MGFDYQDGRWNDSSDLMVFSQRVEERRSISIKMCGEVEKWVGTTERFIEFLRHWEERTQ